MAKKDVQHGTLALMVLKTPRRAGHLPRLRYRPAHRADQRRPAVRQSGRALSRALEIEAGRRHLRKSGALPRTIAAPAFIG